MNHLLASMVLVCLVSCRVSQPPKSADQNSDLPNSPARLAAYRARYATEYAAYRCDYIEFPTVQIHSFTLRQFKPMALSPQLNLRLVLGRRIDQPGTYTYRTGSSYILSSAPGKELSRAESMLLREGAAESNEPIEVIFTPAENYVLIQEENFGAGGSKRHVVFMPSIASWSRPDDAPVVWQALHLDLPARVTGVGGDDHIGSVGGVSGGKIYVEMDGLFYAFPLDKFATTSLGVSNG